MRDKRFVVFGVYDSSSITFDLDGLRRNSFDDINKATLYAKGLIDLKNYDWVSVYDRVEGLILFNG